MIWRADDADEALCIVRDFSGSAQELKLELRLPALTTGSEFQRCVAARFGFEPDSFVLVAPPSVKSEHDKQLIITEDSNKPLKSYGVKFDSVSRNLFIVEGVHDDKPRLAIREEDMEIGASASPDDTGSYNSYNSPPSPPLLNSSDEEKGAKTSVNNDIGLNLVYRCPLVEPQTQKFRGLVNHAMTCYLNSLLQTLYMTPEFRNAVYRWKFDPGASNDDVNSIPFQLQKLFLNLQKSPRRSIETTDLIKSFGWDSSEVWQQHDIQELCRVMFDALESDFKRTDQADLIANLYQGKLIDYVKCTECSNENTQETTCLDIPLPVRPFKSSEAYGSVEEALRAFIQPELLDGVNQYSCGKCNLKVNAQKGLKFGKLPYILTLHLMRFNFDYNTMHRIKLNDRVTFPETLDLNSFISESHSSSFKEEGSEGFPEELNGTNSKCDDGSTTDSGSAIDDENLPGFDDQDTDEGIDMGTSEIRVKKTKPYVYELYSVLVHSGNATGGHYYAYIKDFCSGQWYSFNDQSVTPITQDDIDRSFGGTRNYYSGTASVNAYLLMYRMIDPERNELPFQDDELPPHIKTLWKEMEEKLEHDRIKQERERETCYVKVYAHHPVLDRMINARIECKTRTSLKDVKLMALKELQLNSVSMDQCRLATYNSVSEEIESFLDKEEHTLMEDYVSIYNRKCKFLLDIRNPDEEFKVYKSNTIPLKLHRVYIDTDVVEGPIVHRTCLCTTITNFKEELAEMYNMPKDAHSLLMIETRCSTVRCIDRNPDNTLNSEVVGTNTRVFVCFDKEENILLPLTMRSLVERYVNTITLNISLPDTRPEIFKQLSIQTLSEYANSRSQKFSEDSYEKGEIFGSDGACSLNIMNHRFGMPDSNVGQNSDQSTSEESSLTDSEKTLIGEIPEDYQGSSVASSPRGCENVQTKNIRGDDETDANVLNFRDFSLEEEEPKFCFKEIENQVTFDKKKNGVVTVLKVEVDKRMSIEEFRKRLESYVLVPSANFKMITGDFVNGSNECSSSLVVTDLSALKDVANIIVRLIRPLNENTIKCVVYMLNLKDNEEKLLQCLGDYFVEYESTVAELKQDILDDLMATKGIKIPLQRCRLRMKNGYSPSTVVLDNQRWKEFVMPFVELYFQELDSDESVTDPTQQTCLFIREYSPCTNVFGLFHEIVLDEVNVSKIKEKISKISSIPDHKLILGHKYWSNTLLYSISESDIEWCEVGNLSSLESCLESVKYRPVVIYYKDMWEDEKSKVRKSGGRRNRPLRIYTKRND